MTNQDNEPVVWRGVRYLEIENAIRRLLKNGNLRDYDDEVANRLEDAADILQYIQTGDKNGILPVSAVGQITANPDQDNEPVAWKDGQTRELVNKITCIAKEYAATQQLRERLAHCIVPALKSQHQTILELQEQLASKDEIIKELDGFSELSYERYKENLALQARIAELEGLLQRVHDGVRQTELILADYPRNLEDEIDKALANKSPKKLTNF